MAYIEEGELGKANRDAIRDCQDDIQRAIDELHEKTGLTVKVVKVGIHGKGVLVNAAIGVHVKVKKS